MQMAKMLKDNITMQTIMYQALALQNHTYTWEIRYWDQKWLDMWSMSTGPLHWSMSSGHGDKMGGSTLCSSRARCLVQLLKYIKIPVRRCFHLYSFLPYLIIILNRVLFNKTSPNHSSVTFLSSAIGTSKREVLRLPVCK